MAMASTRACGVCLEGAPDDRTVEIDRQNICHDCLRRVFQRALDNEMNYPPKWGDRRLEAQLYHEQGILSDDFMQAYRSKESEYHCPPTERIFCSWQVLSKITQTDDRCNAFVGQKLPNNDQNDDVLSGRSATALCSLCDNRSCLVCGDRITTTTIVHTCQNIQIDDGEVFRGLERGRDFQICPNERCNRRIELTLGCNHIICMCGMEFCFLCGEPAAGDSDHWDQDDDDGRPDCPRFGRPRPRFNPLRRDGPPPLHFHDGPPRPHRPLFERRAVIPPAALRDPNEIFQRRAIDQEAPINQPRRIIQQRRNIIQPPVLPNVRNTMLERNGGQRPRRRPHNALQAHDSMLELNERMRQVRVGGQMAGIDQPNSLAEARTVLLTENDALNRNESIRRYSTIDQEE